MLSIICANPKGLAPIALTCIYFKALHVSFTFMCALLQTSHFLPYAHASTRGELIFDGRLGLGLGVGAPFLGGGHPSLTPS